MDQSKDYSEATIAALERAVETDADGISPAIEVAAVKPLVVGRQVLSPQYGKGYVHEIEDGTVRVRFGKAGYKRFHKADGGYPFELLDGIKAIKKQSLVEKALARETRTEKKERALRCEHNDNQSLCPKCAHLKASELKEWNLRRTTENRINPRLPSLHQYDRVKISTTDCVLISGSQNLVSADQISNGNQPKIGDGARREDYASAKPIQRVPQTSAATIVKDLHADPTIGVHIGHLRIPLDAPRATRADAPQWLDRRGVYLRTLRRSRSERAEVILRGFYVEGKTDEQIAEAEGWTKDSIKKERRSLVEEGTDFFRSLSA